MIQGLVVRQRRGRDPPRPAARQGRRGHARRRVRPVVGLSGQRTSTRSTTKISVSPGLMTPPAPRSPYAEVRRDDQPAAAADLHALHALVPAGDDLADAEAERQRLAPVVRRVELLAGGVRDPDVVHAHGLAGRRLGALALGEVGDLEVARRRAVGEVDLGLLVASRRFLSQRRPGGPVRRPATLTACPYRRWRGPCALRVLGMEPADDVTGDSVPHPTPQAVRRRRMNPGGPMHRPSHCRGRPLAVTLGDPATRGRE